MKSIAQQHYKFHAWLFAVGAACAFIAALLMAWHPLPSRPWHPEFVEMMPDWVLWLKANEGAYMHSLMIVSAITLAVMSAVEFGDQRE